MCDLTDDLRFWLDVLAASRYAETPDGQDAYEQASWNVRRIYRQMDDRRNA